MTASNPTHRKTSIIELMRSISSGEVAEASIQEEAKRHPGTLNSVSGDEDSEDGSEDFDVFEEEQQSKDGYGGMRQLSTKEKPPPWLDRSLRRPSESELQRPEMQSSPMMVNLDFSLDVLVELLVSKAQNEEKELHRIFTEGDDNGDGVLSFSEFLAIVAKRGECIDPASFVHVCKLHGLFRL
eukprot:gene27076-34974_t